MTQDPVRPLLQSGLYILFGVLPIWLFGGMVQFVFNSLAGPILLILAAAILANFLCFRIFEGVGIEQMAMPLNRAGGRNAIVGTIFGFGAALVAMLVPLLLGIAREVPVKDPAGWRAELFVPLLLVAGAAGEEILFRGYGFQTLVRAFGPFSAILPIGVLFGLMHASNPHSSPVGILNTMGFGMLFGWAFLKSHDIWFPFGLHYGWNLTLLLFGANISGLTMRVTGYELAWSGNPLWTGGEYGPEASLLTTAALFCLIPGLMRAPVRKQTAFMLDRPDPSRPDPPERERRELA